MRLAFDPFEGSDAAIDKVFAVMALCPQHTFQVLTKRAERMRRYFDAKKVQARIAYHALTIFADNLGRCLLADWDGAALDVGRGHPPHWPLPNVWLGVSCERQQEADERIPHLLQTPAAIRFVSAEPLLGPIDFTRLPFTSGDPRHKQDALRGEALMYGDGVNGHPNVTVRMTEPKLPHLDWIIVGGESGPNARPMHPDWARSIGNQCEAAGVAFFFKQWGGWSPLEDAPGIGTEQYAIFPDGAEMFRVGKKRAGRLLDGREHNAFPIIEGRESQPGLSSPDSKQTEDANA